MSGKGLFGVISVHLWDRQSMRWLFEEWANQSQHLGFFARAKLGKPQIMDCRQGGHGCGFVLGISAASLGKDTENIQFILFLLIFTHAQLIFLLLSVAVFILLLWGSRDWREVSQTEFSLDRPLF